MLLVSDIRNEGFELNSLKELVFQSLQKLGPRHRVLIIPPDFTRYHSHAGIITEWIWEYYQDNVAAILPALGTHAAMSQEEIQTMFGKVPEKLFVVHKWRTDVVTLGEVPASFVKEVSEGRVNYSWPAQVNKLLTDPSFDLILSVGQVVPHEVIGMANYNKNIFVGTGGAEGINKSHFLGAAFGMERMMGRVDTPVRKVLNYASKHYASHLPLVYLHTVVKRNPQGKYTVTGFFAGDDEECFIKAAELSLQHNFTLLEKPLKKVVVYLDPAEFKSSWLGNKAIYRTRMAIADGGELYILAPGVKEFGEDPQIDQLIRTYGYRATPEILRYVNEKDDLRGNLSAAAHLIHGSSEGRFKVVYCTEKLTQSEINSVGYEYLPLKEAEQMLQSQKLQEGENPGEIYYISNPAIGLWASKNRFVNSKME